MTARGATPRLSREAWLEAALDVLAREGEGRIRVRQLAKALGVTSGSFYWHFRDRADFVAQIVDYWHDAYTKRISDAARTHKGSPREVLEWIAEHVVREDGAGYDLAVRAWASHEEGVAQVVRRAEQLRVHTTGRQFERMGFTRRDAALRARVFVGHMSIERSITGAGQLSKRVADLHRLLDILCRDASEE